GEGVALPTRLKFKQVPPHVLPKSDVVGAASEDFVAAINPDFIAAVLERWRGATTNQRANLDDGAQEARPMVEAEAAPLQPAAGPGSNLLSRSRVGDDPRRERRPRLGALPPHLSRSPFRHHPPRPGEIVQEERLREIVALGVADASRRLQIGELLEGLDPLGD